MTASYADAMTPPPTRRLSPLLTLGTLTLTTLTLATLSPAAAAAGVWAGVDLTTAGDGARVGVALLPVPFIGTLGVEAGTTRPYNSDSASFSRPPAKVRFG